MVDGVGVDRDRLVADLTALVRIPSITGSEEAVTAYRSANNLVDVTQGNKLINRQVEDVTQQLALTRSRTADARARLERVEQAAQHNSDPASLNESLQSPVIANLRSQYAETARIKAEYSAIYGGKHPSLIAVGAQLDDLRRQIDNEIARILVGVRNDYQTAVSREASLEAELTKLKEQSATLSQADVKLRELEREAQANRTLFEQFLNRAKETTEQQSLQIADARIVAPALAPLRPDRPGTFLLIALAACSGLISGVGLVLILEQLRQGFRSVQEVAQFLSVPSIGMLAMQEPATTERSVAARFALDHPNSAYARNLRAIRMRLLRSSKKPRGEILAVVSALPGEGKSTFACSLAGLMARSNRVKRIVVVDCDLRRSSVVSSLGVSATGGTIDEYLAGDKTLDQTLGRDESSGLYYVPARRNTPNPAEILNSKVMQAFVQGLARQFDLVILDTPPLITVSDARVTAQLADYVVVLVQWEQTSRELAASALKQMRNLRKHVGVVLAQVDVRRHMRYGYSDHGYCNSKYLDYYSS